MSNVAPATTESEVITHCGKCKLDLAHNVLAKLPNGSPAKVQCRTCNAIHKFKVKKEVKAKIKKADKNKLSMKAVNQEEFFQQMRNKYGSTKAHSYSMADVFRVGDRIEHPSFGEGYVMSLFENKKMEVVFTDQIKVLVHGFTE